MSKQNEFEGPTDVHQADVPIYPEKMAQTAIRPQPLRAHDPKVATRLMGTLPTQAAHPAMSLGACDCGAQHRATTPIPAFGPDDEEFWGQPDTRALDAPAPPFESFVEEIRQLFQKSVNKGYGPQRPDAKNPLYEFMRSFFSDDHALGEIVYKAIRYKNKRNPEDLVKIAGWAWLVFMHHWKEEAARGNR